RKIQRCGKAISEKQPENRPGRMAPYQSVYSSLKVPQGHRSHGYSATILFHSDERPNEFTPERNRLYFCFRNGRCGYCIFKLPFAALRWRSSRGIAAQRMQAYNGRGEEDL